MNPWPRKTAEKWMKDNVGRWLDLAGQWEGYRARWAYGAWQVNTAEGNSTHPPELPVSDFHPPRDVLAKEHHREVEEVYAKRDAIGRKFDTLFGACEGALEVSRVTNPRQLRTPVAAQKLNGVREIIQAAIKEAIAQPAREGKKKR